MGLISKGKILSFFVYLDENQEDDLILAGRKAQNQKQNFIICNNNTYLKLLRFLRKRKLNKFLNIKHKEDFLDKIEKKLNG